ncbi:MAG: VCBS repeat-containing protein [Acidobacteria bacterium]|nr:VCBS repeat-containing protein [Acidobacteriota bacterium]
MKNLLLSIFVCLIITLAANVARAGKPLDFDGDGKSDFAVSRYRTVGADTLLDWYAAGSRDNALIYAQFGIGFNGQTGDLLVPADYDGDGKTDVAVWRIVGTGQPRVFYILNSSNGTVRIEYFGTDGDDIRALGDYDGDGKTDLAVYRPTSAPLQNYFIYKGSLNNPNGNLTYLPWGSGFGATPVRGDFDGDGKRDACIRLNNQFILRRSSDGGVEYVTWGLANDFAFTGDFDGDGKTDFGARRTGATNFEWYTLERDGGGTGGTPILWGRQGSPLDLTLTPADYDGDGRDDIGVYRLTANPNTFYIRRSADGSLLAYQWGTSGDSPLVNYQNY